MAFTKKEWFRPELIVLARNKPEEAVLDVCKFGSASGPEAGEALRHCRHGNSVNPLTPCIRDDIS